MKSPKLKNIEVFTYINNFSKRLRHSSQIFYIKTEGLGRLNSILPQEKKKKKNKSREGIIRKRSVDIPYVKPSENTRKAHKPLKKKKNCIIRNTADLD